jgi:hypothetical protein
MSNESAMSERRDRELERSAHRRIGSPFSAKVVGVSFVEHYPSNLYALDMEAATTARLGERLAAVLVRNPANEYDPNAIEVHVPALGDIGMIGHLTRPVAARLAPELDAGVRWLAEVDEVLVDPDHPDRPGISINCKREE